MQSTLGISLHSLRIFAPAEQGGASTEDWITQSEAPGSRDVLDVCNSERVSWGVQIALNHQGVAAMIRPLLTRLEMSQLCGAKGAERKLLWP